MPMMEWRLFYNSVNMVGISIFASGMFKQVMEPVILAFPLRGEWLSYNMVFVMGGDKYESYFI